MRTSALVFGPYLCIVVLFLQPPARAGQLPNARVIDRTYSCSVEIRAGAREVQVQADAGVRWIEDRSKWKRLAGTSVGDSVTGLGHLSTGNPLAPENGFRFPPQRLGIPAGSNCRAARRGLGYGLVSSLTSPDVARAGFVGTGFRPARGWTVVQAGAVSPTGAATAVATNVALDPEDDPGETPHTTLEYLPAHGIVVVATFTSRGDPEADLTFPVRTLPLRFADARPAPANDLLPLALDVAGYQLRAAVAGTNVDVRIYFGMSRPSAKVVAAAQRQLGRLVVASERVTIFARPTIADRTPVTVFGSVDNGRAGEAVTIQAKDCGSAFFRVFSGAETREGGGWSTIVYPRISTALRAVWKDSATAQIAIKRRAIVGLHKKRRGSGFRVSAGGFRSFWRKKVVIQRRQGNAWRTAKTVVLTDSLGGGTPNSGSWTEAEFTLSVPTGTLVRAVMPIAQARPCYIAGVSQTVRT